MTILNSSAFSLVYYLFTFFAIEASFVIAWGHWRRSLSLRARRFAVAFGGFGLLRLAMFLLLHNQPATIKTSLEQTLVIVAFGILAWSLSPYFYNRPATANIFLTVNTLSALGLLGLNFFIDGSSLSAMRLIWQIALGVLLLFTLIKQFTPDQSFNTTAVLVLTFGSLVQFIYGERLSVTAGSTILLRLSEIVAYPLLVVAIYQEVIESLNIQSQALESLSVSTREQIEGFITLFEASQSLFSSLDLSLVLDGAVQSVGRTLNVDQCGIAMPEDSDSTSLRMVATYSPHREGRGEAITFPLSDQAAIRHAMDHRRPVEITNAYNSPPLKFLFALLGATDRTGPLVVHPLMCHDEVVGVLMVGNAHSKRVPGPTETRLLTTMANQIGIAIDNARSYKAMVTKSQQLAWTLRNNEQESSRRKAAMEAELQKSRQEASMLSRRLSEQETIAQKKQDELVLSQKQTTQLTQQLKSLQAKIISLNEDNTRLASEAAIQQHYQAQLQQAQEELRQVRTQVQELEFEAGEARKNADALESAQQRSRKLSRALRLSQTKIQQLTSVSASVTAPLADKDLENLSCGVLISDARGIIGRANLAASQLFKTDHLTGKTLASLIADEAWQKALQKIVTERPSFLAIPLTVGGQTMKATISPIINPVNGQLNGNVILFYDAAEEQENQHARDEFVASLAQELRTPMTSIIGYVDLLIGESVGMIGDMQRKFLQRVKANIERMDGLLNDLIGIAAIDAGQLEISPVALNMGEIIEDAILGAKAQLEEKEIQLQLNLLEHSPMIEADPTCMQQVMANLLANASKSSPVGGKIEVRTMITNGKTAGASAADDDEQEKWLRVSITDSGGGIAEKDRDRVFERFYKAEHPLIQGLGETGVGLSIVKYLIEAHGGEIWFDTEIGKGTTFHFALGVTEYYDDPWQEVNVPPLDLNSDL